MRAVFGFLPPRWQARLLFRFRWTLSPIVDGYGHLTIPGGINDRSRMVYSPLVPQRLADLNNVF